MNQQGNLGHDSEASNIRIQSYQDHHFSVIICKYSAFCVNEAARTHFLTAGKDEIGPWLPSKNIADVVSYCDAAVGMKTRNKIVSLPQILNL